MKESTDNILPTEWLKWDIYSRTEFLENLLGGKADDIRTELLRNAFEECLTHVAGQLLKRPVEKADTTSFQLAVLPDGLGYIVAFEGYTVGAMRGEFVMNEGRSVYRVNFTPRDLTKDEPMFEELDKAFGLAHKGRSRFQSHNRRS